MLVFLLVHPELQLSLVFCADTYVLRRHMISFFTVVVTLLLILDLLRAYFEVRHPRCVGSITKNFLCIAHAVEHNYISPSSTEGIQLHVSALYVGHIQVVI